MPVVTVPDADLLDRLGAPPSGLRYAVWDLDDRSGAPEGPLDLVVMPYMAPAPVLDVLAGLEVRAVQSLALGYDRVADHLAPEVVFCNAAGVHEGATAEHAVALILAAQRELPAFVDQQRAGEWRQDLAPGLIGRRVLIVGTGGVGEAVRSRLAPFEVEIVRCATRARQDEHGPVHAVTELPELLPAADVVVLAVPLTPATRHLVDTRFLAALPDGALVVNVARGPVVDTEALLAALTAGRVRAALDVTDPEPLPADHPLRTAPGLILTPHVAGRTTTMAGRLARLVRDQATRLAEGRPLANRVTLS